jgi:hypothetical protein
MAHEKVILMEVIGPKLCAGNELATAASMSLGTEIEFEDISESVHTYVKAFSY